MAAPDRPRLLGAIIAGGRATRFCGDKAAALINGRPLIEHVAEALAPQCADLIVCGRDWPGLASVADQPMADLGPLGGLAAALAYAEAHGFDAVLSAGCDVLPVPADLAARLLPGPSVVAGQPLFGLWPSGSSSLLLSRLAGPDRSIRGWVEAAKARSIAIDIPLHNFNRREDLEKYRD